MDLSRCFLETANCVHRQYEALRAVFVEGLSAAQVAERFGYTVGSVRVMVSKFRSDPDRQFFVSSRRGSRVATAKRERLRDRVVAMRKQNLSIYDISRALERKGQRLSAVSVSQILRDEGFARLPRRRDDERPARPGPDAAQQADVRRLDLSPRRLRTRFGGLFLFLPYLADMPFDEIVRRAGLPGTAVVPAAHAMRSLLALKLFGAGRHSHVMSDVFDEGLALFAGLNAIPKRSFLTEYSCRIDPGAYPKLMRRWFDAVAGLGMDRGQSFDLDFHTIPFHGDDALVEKHYVSKRSRRQKGILAFLAQDASTRVFCYANAEARKQGQNDEILRFVDFWREQTGRLPDELIFDSKLTTYANLSRLNRMGIAFTTLRRRSRKTLEHIASRPRSAWRQVRLEGVSRAYTTPRLLDETIVLRDYDGPIRQITVADLGHDKPTLLLTNQLRRSARKLIERYARRMLIENNIADGVDFFHIDALSSAVAMKVSLDLQLTLMASSLYRLLAQRVGAGYENAKSRHLFRDFVNAVATVDVGEKDILVRYQKRAHNPLLLAAGFDKIDAVVPWLGNKHLRFILG